MGAVAAAWAGFAVAAHSARMAKKNARKAASKQRKVEHKKQGETDKLDKEAADQAAMEKSSKQLDKNRARKKMQGAGADGREASIKTKPGGTTGTSTSGSGKSLLGL